MNALAASLLICTVLYLVDKNHQWSRLWKISKSLTGIAIGVGVVAILDALHIEFWTMLIIFVAICAIAAVIKALWNSYAVRA